VVWTYHLSLVLLATIISMYLIVFTSMSLYSDIYPFIFTWHHQPPAGCGLFSFVLFFSYISLRDKRHVTRLHLSIYHQPPSIRRDIYQYVAVRRHPLIFLHFVSPTSTLSTRYLSVCRCTATSIDSSPSASQNSTH